MLTGYSAFQADEEYTDLGLASDKYANQKTFLNVETKKEDYTFDIFDTEIHSRDLIENLLLKKPNDRLEIHQVLNHAYFDEFRMEDDDWEKENIIL